MRKFLCLLFMIPLILGLFTFKAYSVGVQLPSDLDDDTLFLAATLWSEAKNDSTGMQIVANTILNRKKYYEQQSNGEKRLSIKDIVSNTDQYASWKGKNWDSASIIKNMVEYDGADKAKWETCVNYAKRALAGELPDITGGATGYYSKGAETVPEWARGAKDVQTINDKVVVRGATMENLVDGNNNVIVTGGTSYKTETSSSSISADSSSGGQTCDGIETPLRDISANNSGYGIVSDRTLENMTNMLNRIYQNLGRVFMLGHGLFCYAQKVAYTCVGVDVPVLPSACAMKIPNMSYLLCGVAIYFTAFLISIAIGMYFIDICFKLGFAVIYLPIAIALWPFAPTKSKFMEVFGMILHTAMLYAMLSIGLTYGILLIYNGVLGDVSNWTSFWKAIEQESSEILAENFSITATRTIVILFCLVFGFKIIRSSVDNYLNTFFSDAVTGGENPMHHLGTQFMGMTGGNLIGMGLHHLSGAASRGAGKVIESTGNAMVNVGQQIKGKTGDSANSDGGFQQFLQEAQSGKYGTVVQRKATTFNTNYNRFQNAEFDDVNHTGNTQKGATGTTQNTATTGNTGGTVNNATTGTTNNATTGGTVNNATTGNQKGTETTSTDAVTQNSQQANNTKDASTAQVLNYVTAADSNTLTPFNILGKTGTFVGNGMNSLFHPQQTFNTLKNLSMQGVNSENSPYQNGSLILTNTGKVLFRKFTPDFLQSGLSSNNSFGTNAEILAQNTAIGVAQTTRGTIGDTFIHAGNIVGRLGKSFQDTSKNYGFNDSYSRKKAEEEKEKERQAEEAEVNRTMGDDDA